MTIKSSVNILLGGHLGDSRRLLQAADRGDAAVVSEIISRCPQLATFGGFHHSNTALHRAAHAGHMALCRAVVEPLQRRVSGGSRSASGSSRSSSGAPRAPASPCASSFGEAPSKQARLLETVLNQRSGSGLTPLMLACRAGHAQVAAYLLQQGADPTLVEWTTMRSCLHYAALAGSVECLRLLCADGTRWQAPPSADRSGAAPPSVPLRDFVLRDIQVGQAKYIDVRSYGGLTPLHCAVVTGSLEAVRVLLDAGAAIMVRTDGDAYVGEDFLVPGSTPLHMAVITGNASVVHALLAAHQAFMSSLGSGFDARGRRPWEGSSRSDIRSVRNSLRRLPYHLARERRMTTIQALVDPRVPIDVALDASRDSTAGIGPKRLSTLCAMCLQQGLLEWLDCCAEENEAASGTTGSDDSRDGAGAAGAAGVAPPPRDAFRKPSEIALSSGAAIVEEPATTPRPGAEPSSAAPPPIPDRAQTPQARQDPFQGTSWSVPTTPAGTSTRQRPRHARVPSAAGEMFGFSTAWGGPVGGERRSDLDASLHAYAGMLSMRRQHSLTERGDPAGRAVAGSGRSLTLAVMHRTGDPPISPMVQLPRVMPARQASLPTSVARALGGVATGGSPAPPVGPPTSISGAGATPRPASAGATDPILVLRSSGSVSGTTPTVRGVLQSLRGRGWSSGGDGAQGATSPGGGAAPVLAQAPSQESSCDDKLASSKADAELSADDTLTASDSQDDAECGICLDHKVEVAFAGCEHALCLSCARHLTQANKRPPCCPFCRRMVVGFTRVASARGDHSRRSPVPTA